MGQPCLDLTHVSIVGLLVLILINVVRIVRDVLVVGGLEKDTIKRIKPNDTLIQQSNSNKLLPY